MPDRVSPEGRVLTTLPVYDQRTPVRRLEAQAHAWGMRPVDLLERMLDAMQAGQNLQRLGALLDA